MLEELKLLIETFKGLSDMALYALGGYGLYKLILYLSTTGSAVFIAKLLINRVFDYLNSPKDFRLDKAVYVSRDAVKDLNDLLKRIACISRHTSYGLGLDESDVKWAQEAIEAKMQKEREAGLRRGQGKA